MVAGVILTNLVKRLCNLCMPRELYVKVSFGSVLQVFYEFSRLPWLFRQLSILFRQLDITLRDSATAAHLNHNQDSMGSNPIPATRAGMI